MIRQIKELKCPSWQSNTVQVSAGEWGQRSRLTLTVAVYVLFTAGVSKQGKKERLHTEWPWVKTRGRDWPQVSSESSHQIYTHTHTHTIIIIITIIIITGAHISHDSRIFLSAPHRSDTLSDCLIITGNNQINKSVLVSYRRPICGGVADCDLDQLARLHSCCRQADVQWGAVVCERVNPVRQGHRLLQSDPGDLGVYGVDKEWGVGVQNQGLDPRLDRDEVQNQPAAHFLHSKVQPQVQMEVLELEAAEVWCRCHIHHWAPRGPGTRTRWGPARVPNTPAPRDGQGFTAAAKWGGSLLELCHHELKLGLNPV